MVLGQVTGNPTLKVLSFFFNSRILQTGILQTRPNQFVENQKRNHDNTGRFGKKNLPKRRVFLPKPPVSFPSCYAMSRDFNYDTN